MADDETASIAAPPDRSWERWHSKLQLIFNCIVAAGTLLALGATIYQLYSSAQGDKQNAENIAKAFHLAQRSAEATERAARAADIATQTSQDALKATRDAVALFRQQIATTTALERPHVVVESIGRLSLDSPYDPLTVQLRNIGRSDARTVRVRVNAAGSGLATEVPCNWSRPRIAALGLGVGQTTTHNTPRVPISARRAMRIVGKEAKLFLWFSISYEDVFGTRDEAPACWVAAGTGLTARGAAPWRPCDVSDLKRNARMKCE